MDRFEMVEELCAKTNVSYEKAKTVLESTNWDLLEALVLLEGEGKAKSGTESAVSAPEKEERRTHAGWFDRLCGAAGKLVRQGNAITFEVHRGGKLVFSLPLTVLVLLLVFMFWCVVPLAIVGLFFNYRYSFRGGQVSESVNRAMEKASGIAENIKNNVMDDGDEKKG